jgi:hypothetical protein
MFQEEGEKREEAAAGETRSTQACCGNGPTTCQNTCPPLSSTGAQGAARGQPNEATRSKRCQAAPESHLQAPPIIAPSISLSPVTWSVVGGKGPHSLVHMVDKDGNKGGVLGAGWCVASYVERI